MSSIKGLQSFDIRQAQRLSGLSATQSSGSTQSPDAKLDSVLSESGLSEKDQASLKKDLKASLDSVFSSGSFPPDASKIESSVKSVFEKYGLDADKLSAKLQPPGGGFPGAGGPPPAGFSGGGFGVSSSDDDSKSKSTTTTDTTQTLLDAIKSFVEKLSANGSSKETTDYLFSGLIGFDKKA